MVTLRGVIHFRHEALTVYVILPSTPITTNPAASPLKLE
jgi:hypothetical protein